MLTGPANTASSANAVRSSGSRSSSDQAIRVVSVRCRSVVPRTGDRNRSSRVATIVASSSRPIELNRAAAISIASGSRSTASTIRSTDATSTSADTEPAAATPARSRNRLRAARRSSGVTGHTCSSVAPSRSRLVARIRARPGAPMTVSTTEATASTRCSQLSSTTRASSSPRVRRAAAGSPTSARIPTAVEQRRHDRVGVEGAERRRRRRGRPSTCDRPSAGSPARRPEPTRGRPDRRTPSRPRRRRRARPRPRPPAASCRPRPAPTSVTSPTSTAIARRRRCRAHDRGSVRRARRALAGGAISPTNR